MRSTSIAELDKLENEPSETSPIPSQPSVSSPFNWNFKLWILVFVVLSIAFHPGINALINKTISDSLGGFTFVSKALLVTVIIATASYQQVVQM